MGFFSAKKIGLALGSGAARGLAHIGVLKVIEQEQIEIAAISGTSIGALIGALYAAGVPISEIEEVARSVDWRKMAGWVTPRIPLNGLVDGKRITGFFEEILPVRDFAELKVPLVMVATDIETGDPVIIKSGDLVTALRAAIAFPGIFTPVSFGNRFLVDGGLCYPVPVGAVRDLGADAVIGVCAIPKVDKPDQEAFLPSPGTAPPAQSSFPSLFQSSRFDRIWQEILSRKNTGVKTGNSCHRSPNIFRVFAQSVAIMENQINDLRLAKDQIDVLIRPEMPGINLFDFHRAGELIAIGELAARKLLPQIRKL